jgi:hypothetical protein
MMDDGVEDGSKMERMNSFDFSEFFHKTKSIIYPYQDGSLSGE